jgi:hypothetical protein
MLILSKLPTKTAEQQQADDASTIASLMRKNHIVVAIVSPNDAELLPRSVLRRLKELVASQTRKRSRRAQ